MRNKVSLVLDGQLPHTKFLQRSPKLETAPTSDTPDLAPSVCALVAMSDGDSRIRAAMRANQQLPGGKENYVPPAQLQQHEADAHTASLDQEDMPSTPSSGRLKKRRRHDQPSYATPSASKNVRRPLQPLAPIDTAHDPRAFVPAAQHSRARRENTPAHTPGLMNANRTNNFSTIGACAKTNSERGCDNESVAPYMPLSTRDEKVDNHPEDFLDASSFQQIDVFATSYSGPGEPEAFIPMRAESELSANNGEELEHEYLGTIRHDLKMEQESAALSQREVHLEFEPRPLYGHSLLTGSEFTASLPTLTPQEPMVEVNEIDCTGIDSVSTEVYGNHSRSATACSSDDGEWSADDETVPCSVEPNATSTISTQDFPTLPLELWIQILDSIEASTTAHQHYMKYLEELSHHKILNLHLAVKAKQWEICVLRSGRAKRPLDELTENELKCLKYVKQTVITVPNRRSCDTERHVFDRGQREFVSIIRHFEPKSITRIVLDRFNVLGPEANKAFGKAVDKMENIQVAQLAQTVKNSEIVRANVSFVVDTGYIIVCCPAYVDLGIASNLLKKKNHGKVRATLLGAKCKGTTQNDLRILFREVNLSDVHTMSVLHLDMVTLTLYMGFKTIKWLSIDECQNVTEFFKTQSQMEPKLEVLQWRDFGAKTTTTVRPQLQDNFLRYLASCKKLQGLDVQLTNNCPKIIQSFADKLPGGQMTSLSVDTADLRTAQSMSSNFRKWSDKFPKLESLHHPIAGADMWLRAGDLGEWDIGSEYEDLIKEVVDAYRGCQGLRHLAIGAFSSPYFSKRLDQPLFCEDLAQNVSRVFKDGGIGLATISVNVRLKSSFDDVRAYHFVIDEQEGTVSRVYSPRARKGDLKKACTLLGLDTACELDDHLPADLAIITPESKIPFKKWWDLRSCSIEAVRWNSKD